MKHLKNKYKRETDFCTLKIRDINEVSVTTLHKDIHRDYDYI